MSDPLQVYLDIPSNLTGVASPFLLLTDWGTQIYEHDGTAAILVGWRGKIEFPTVASLSAWTGPLGPAGTMVWAQGFRYTVTDDPFPHLETAGGVGLLLDYEEVIDVAALGAQFDGSSEDAILERALAIAQGRKVLIPDSGQGLRITGTHDWSSYEINLVGDGIIDLGSQESLTSKRIRVGPTLKINGPTIKGGGVQFHSIDETVDVNFQDSRFIGHAVVFEARGTSVVNSFKMTGCHVSKLAAGDRDGNMDVFFNTTTTFRDVAVLGNRFANGGRQALLLMSALSDLGQRVVVSDNIFHDYMLPFSTSNTDAQFIRVYGDSVTITGNVFSELNWHEGGISPSNVEAIYIQAVDGITITGNNFRNAGAAEGNISAKAGILNILISGNTFINTENYKTRLSTSGTSDVASIAFASARGVTITNNIFDGAYNRIVKAADGGNMDFVVIEGNKFRNCTLTEAFRFRNANTNHLSIKENESWDGNVINGYLLHVAAGVRAKIEDNDFGSLTVTGGTRSLITNPNGAIILSRGNKYPQCGRIIEETGYAYAQFENDAFVQDSGAQQNLFGSSSTLRGLRIIDCTVRLTAVGGSNRLLSLPRVSNAALPTAIASLSYDLFLENATDEYIFRWRGEILRSSGAWSVTNTELGPDAGTGGAVNNPPDLAAAANLIWLRVPASFGFVGGMLVLSYQHKTKDMRWL